MDKLTGKAERVASAQEPPTTSHAHSATTLMRLAGMEPDPWQERVATTDGDQLLLCHRQAGKSTIVGAVALEDATSEEESLVLCVSPSLRQSGELYRKVKQFYNAARPMALRRDTALSMELANGSRIMSLPGNEQTLVGFSRVKRLIIDEAARTTDAMYYALRPMLAVSQGNILALSTPWGKRGWFYEAWQGKEATQDALLRLEDIVTILAGLGITVTEADLPSAAQLARLDWHRTLVTAKDSTRLAKAFLARERRDVPDLYFRQEWLCEFVEAMDAVFRYDDLQATLHPELTPLFVPKPEETLLDSKVHPLFQGVSIC
jgi:hypothetical protein